MKRSLVTVILLFIALMTACQSTPDKPVVIQKDMEQMIEKAGDENNGTQLEDIVIPDGRYTFESTGADGKLNINVDASIEKPVSGNMPIVRASIGSFSQEIVTAVFNYLFPNEKPIDRIQVQTKTDIEAILINLRKQLADGSYKDNDYTEEECKTLIADMEAQYKAAPETAPEQAVSDGTMKLSKDKGGMYMLDVESDTASFQVINPVGEGDAAMIGICHMNYHNSSAPSYNTLGITRTDGTDIPDDAKGKLTISYGDAKTLCDDFFSAAGLSDDFCVGASFIVDDRGTGLSGGKFVNGQYVEGPKDPAENYAYQFYYTRKVGNIPAAVNARAGGSNESGFSIPWCYEYVCFTVDNNGLAKMVWSDPIDVGETVEESATLKPFDEIMQVFEKMIKMTYEANIDTYSRGQAQMEVNVDDIQLCLLRIREQSGDETAGLLVPAWVFYGHNMTQNDSDNDITYDRIGGGSTMWPQAPIVLLAINAIDGNIIDLAKGY